VLVELSVVEQRYQAVLAVVQDGSFRVGPLSIRGGVATAGSLREGGKVQIL
jgi:hypothetical protein